MNKDQMDINRLIVDVIRGSMEMHPEGITFKAVSEYVLKEMEGDEECPTPSDIYRRLEFLSDYDGMVAKSRSGLYTSPDLDEVASSLGLEEWNLPQFYEV